MACVRVFWFCKLKEIQCNKPLTCLGCVLVFVLCNYLRKAATLAVPLSFAAVYFCFFQLGGNTNSHQAMKFPKFAVSILLEPILQKKQTGSMHSTIKKKVTKTQRWKWPQPAYSGSAGSFFKWTLRRRNETNQGPSPMHVSVQREACFIQMNK